MVVTTVVWGIVLAVTYDFVRVFKTYDYRSLFTQLLGNSGFSMKYAISSCFS